MVRVSLRLQLSPTFKNICPWGDKNRISCLHFGVQHGWGLKANSFSCSGAVACSTWPVVSVGEGGGVGFYRSHSQTIQLCRRHSWHSLSVGARVGAGNLITWIGLLWNWIVSGKSMSNRNLPKSSWVVLSLSNELLVRLFVTGRVLILFILSMFFFCFMASLKTL